MNILDRPFKHIELNDELIEELILEFDDGGPSPAEIIKDFPKFLREINRKVSKAEDIGNLLLLRAESEKRLENFEKEVSPYTTYLNNMDMYEEISPEYSEKMHEKVSDLFLSHIVSRALIAVTGLYISKIQIPEYVVEAFVAYAKEAVD